MNPKVEAVKIALREMFTSNSFNICTIDRCLKITNSNPNKETYDIMSAMHCINYSEMSPEFREWIFDETLKMFSNNEFDLGRIDLIDKKKYLG